MKEFNVTSKYPITNAFIDLSNNLESINSTKLFTQLQETIMQEKLVQVQQQLSAQFEKKLAQEVRKSYQKGFQEGQKQTEKKLQGQVSHSIHVIQTISRSLKSEISNIIANDEKEILSLVLEIAKKIIKTEISLNPEIIKSILLNALSLIHEKHNIKIYVNPKDWNTVQTIIQDSQLEFDLPKQIEIAGSKRIAQGGCIIETASGTINADIDAQFNEIKKKLTANE